MPDSRAAAFVAALALFVSAGRPATPGVLPAKDDASFARQAPRVERTAPPGAVPPALRAAVANECVTLVLPTGGVVRVWPARQVPAAAPPEPDEPALLRERVRSSIEPGSLVAIASWELPWRDYRDQQIPAGTYALVYAIQPAFKQHRGVSEFRDVLLLVPPLEALADRDLTRLVAASRVVSGTSHPAVAALFPVDPGAELHRVSQRSDGGLTLEFRAGAFRLGLAVSGKGRLDGAEP
jgi:hypothetical protein